MDDRGGGRGYHRGGRHRHRGRGRGRGRGNRHHPYHQGNNHRNHHRHRGGRGRPGNRFGASSFAQRDPETEMLRQLFSFVSRVGEFKNIPEAAPPAPGAQRPLEAATAGNIRELVEVLCSDPSKVDALVRCQPSAPAPLARIGTLAHVVVSCAASLPLQTPCYAGLTLALGEKVAALGMGPGPSGEPPLDPYRWAGFAPRCAAYAADRFAADLDAVLGTGKNVSRASCRMKLLLRYLALLGKTGIVKGYEEKEEEAGVGVDSGRLTVFGLLSMLVQAAGVSNQRSLPASVAYLLVSLVLSTLPYVVEYVPAEAIDAFVLGPVEAVLKTYRSAFSPGKGCASMLLEGEQDDGEDMGDEDEDDDEEDDDEDSSGQVCDSLQDLLRVCKTLRDQPSRFALPQDAPWKGLTRTVAVPAEESTAEAATTPTETRTVPVVYTGEACYLSVTECNSLRFLLAGVGEFKVFPPGLDGVVFGRLPIFGSPPDPEDDDDEEDMDDGAAKNEELQAFRNGFGLIDRCFVAEAIRDCLISHETVVNPTGLQLGSPKSAAEELLGLGHVFTGENPSRGMAYAIVETLFGLVVQSREGCALRHVFVSRVLLELTRLRPSLVSPALAVAMTSAFDDYLPALVPPARDNIGRWFAFHLTNTEYQWPSAYWQLWEPHALSEAPTSRGSFVRHIVQSLVENVSDPSVVVRECLSGTKSLAEEIFPRTSTTLVEYTEEDTLGQFEREIEKRLWDQDENPDALLEYLLSEGVTTSLAPVEGRWPKTVALVRVLLSPIKNIRTHLKDLASKKEEEGMDQMVEDTHDSKDYYMLVEDAIDKYGRCIQGLLANEAESYGDVTEGGALVLRQAEIVGCFNASVLRGLVACFLRRSVVGSTAVARWALGDLGDTSTTGTPAVVPRWWNFASDALQASAISTGGNSNESMVVDGSAAEASALADCRAMLAYAVKRVCSLLTVRNEKRLDPLQVDLLEGMKSVALRAKSLDSSGTSTSGLADLCSGFGGAMAVELLKNSLMQL